MKYQSTRSADLFVSASTAILSGIANDGGLYTFNSLKDVNFDYKTLIGKSIQEMATEILSIFLTDFTKDEVEKMVTVAYKNKFETDDLTPTVAVGDDSVLELFRGPTSAFKDFALSLLPYLMKSSFKKLNINDKIVILTATSGDTGKASLEAFHDVENTKIIVFYPNNGVSEIQKLQMATQVGKNVYVCAINGNFDDAQTGVKNIFNYVNENKIFANKAVRLSSANSINIGRLLPQTVYYFKSYLDLVNKNKIKLDDKVDFIVPTGNFGDILAGFIAKSLGLPIGKLICASNKNNILTDFLTTGIYDRNRHFYKTNSPSMDILISSNLERLLFILSNGDCKYIKSLMEQLKNDGKYTVSNEILNKIKNTFYANWCDDEETEKTIGDVYKKYNYLLDTHSAVAYCVAQKYKQDNKQHNYCCVLSTASPYKFPKAVLRGINGKTSENDFQNMEQICKLTTVKIPKNLTNLQQLPILHKDVIDVDKMLDYVIKKIEE